MTNDLKQKLGASTEKLESLISPYYTSLESWKHGLLLISLTLFLLFSIYYLTKSTKTEKTSAKQEAQAEEKLMRQMAFFKRLRD